jgi:hypothetical protein
VTIVSMCVCVCVCGHVRVDVGVETLKGSDHFTVDFFVFFRFTGVPCSSAAGERMLACICT